MVRDCPAAGFDEIGPELCADLEVFYCGSFAVVERVGQDRRALVCVVDEAVVVLGYCCVSCYVWEDDSLVEFLVCL